MCDTDNYDTCSFAMCQLSLLPLYSLNLWNYLIITKQPTSVTICSLCNEVWQVDVLLKALVFCSFTYRSEVQLKLCSFRVYYTSQLRSQKEKCQMLQFCVGMWDHHIRNNKKQIPLCRNRKTWHGYSVCDVAHGFLKETQGQTWLLVEV